MGYANKPRRGGERRESANCCSVRPGRRSVRAPARGARLSRPFSRPGRRGLWLAAAPNAASATQGQWRGGHYGQGRPARGGGLRRSPGSTHPLARAPLDARRAPIRGGRRCSPAWGDCAEPMALLAASARLHRRPAPRRPGGAPSPPPAALVLREGSLGLRPESTGQVRWQRAEGSGPGRGGLVCCWRPRPPAARPQRAPGSPPGLPGDGEGAGPRVACRARGRARDSGVLGLAAGNKNLKSLQIRVGK